MLVCSNTVLNNSCQLDDNDKEMMDKLRVKDEVLAELKDKMILKQMSFDDL